MEKVDQIRIILGLTKGDKMMSDNIIPFNNGNEEEHHCPTCDLIHEFMVYILDADSAEEIFGIVTGLVKEAKDLGLKEYLAHEIDSKIALFEHLENGCCEEE
jgi:hypothetical protein